MVEQVEVLIVSDDAGFVNSLVQSWHPSTGRPEFAVSSIHGTGQLSEGVVAVIDNSDPAALANVLARLPDELLLAIAVGDDHPLPEANGRKTRVLRVQRGAGSAEVVAALAHETVLRAGAQQRVAEVEEQLRHSARFAALGQFINGARHGLGNALTSVLGNSELALLEMAESGLKNEVRGQLETVHAMSLKIHETLHRLSTLDMEMQMAERQAGREQGWPANSSGATTK